MITMAMHPDMLPKPVSGIPSPPIESVLYATQAENAAELLARGHPVPEVAGLLNISKETVRNWQEYKHFAALVEAKKGEYRKMLLDRIEEAGRKPHLWTANSWILERSPQFEGVYRNDKQTIDLNINVFRHISAQDLAEVIDLSEDDVKLLEGPETHPTDSQPHNLCDSGHDPLDNETP